MELSRIQQRGIPHSGAVSIYYLLFINFYLLFKKEEVLNLDVETHGRASNVEHPGYSLGSGLGGFFRIQQAQTRNFSLHFIEYQVH